MQVCIVPFDWPTMPNEPSPVIPREQPDQDRSPGGPSRAPQGPSTPNFC